MSNNTSDPTQKKQAMNAAEMAHAIPGEGRTVQQWLEQDKVGGVGWIGGG